MTQRRKLYFLSGLLLGVFLFGYYRGGKRVAPAPGSLTTAGGNSVPSSAESPGVPSVIVYTPPSIHLPFTAREKAPTSRPIPLPEGKVDKVIRIHHEATGEATGPIPEPIEIAISTSGDVQAPAGQGARLEVIQFGPKTAALERRPGVGWRVSADEVEPLAVLSLLNIKGRLRFAVTAGRTGPGVAALVRLAGSAKVAGWTLSLGPEYATGWKFDNHRICAVGAITF